MGLAMSRMTKKSKINWVSSGTNVLTKLARLGGWFSWGSPVGLGLFFIELAAAAWIIAQIFCKNAAC